MGNLVLDNKVLTTISTLAKRLKITKVKTGTYRQKIFSFVILFCFIFILGYGEVEKEYHNLKREYYDLNGKRISEKEFIEKGKNGKEIWFQNGHKCYQIKYRDGLKHGKCFTWHDNEKKEFEGEWKKGKKCGKWIWWDRNGNIIEEKIYKNGIMIGGKKHLEEKENSKLISKNINRELHFRKEYYDLQNERISKEKFYANGKNGKIIQYYLNEMKEINFKDGKEHGKCIGWWLNGRKHIEGEYKKGKKHGKWITWLLNGQKSSEYKYIDGNLQGKSIEWYQNGQKELEVIYKDNKRHGKLIHWYENGKKELEGYMENGKRKGEWNCWYENGQKHWLVVWKDSVLSVSVHNPRKNFFYGYPERAFSLATVS